MPRNDTASAVLDVEPHAAHPPAQAARDEPFCILVMGSFAGAAPRNSRAPVEMDRDNLDDVLGRIAPELHLRMGGLRVDLRFRELGDFHPDAIWRECELFRRIEKAAAPKAAGASSAAPAAPVETDGLLDRMLASASPDESPIDAANDLRAFIDRALAPYLVRGETPEVATARERVHAAQSEAMRAILHAPAFQRLESAWRGIDFLIRRTETGPNLKIFIAEGPGDLRSEDAIPAAPRGHAWSAIVVDRAFGRSDDDLAMLSQLGRRAMAFNAALLAEAEPPGDDAGQSERWDSMRRRAEAPHIGLALPRFLARLPYGKSGETTDEFAFEEMPKAPRHADYLWCNPAFACTYLLAAAFERQGWNMIPGSIREIDRLPLHVYTENGESVAKPCAELLLNENDVEQLLDEGIMPLASIRDQDRVRLVRFQSIADPLQNLAGPWQ